MKRKHPESVWAEAKKLLKSGLSKKAIAEKLNVSYYTVCYNLDIERYRVTRGTATMKWMKNNPERTRKIMARAHKNYIKRVYDENGDRLEAHRERARKKAKKRYIAIKSDPKRYAEYLKKRRDAERLRRKHGQNTTRKG